jgi:prepilin-type N-terminal cleavage/methylation domain-containing protein
MEKFKKSRLKICTGFTLIELVIVMGIISILSVGILTVLKPADQFQKVSDSRRKSDLFQIQKALEQYYEDNGRYPAVSSDGKHQITSTNGLNVVWGGPWIPYMNLVPKDPSYPTRTYVYSTDSTGQSYFLYASLDRGSKDNKACNSGNACSSLSTQSPAISSNTCATDGSICNYAVTSPNVFP